MRLLKILLQRGRPPKSNLEGLFALSAAYRTLTAQDELEAAGRAGLCFRPADSSAFATVEYQVRNVVLTGTRYMNTKVESHDDSYGFRWLVLDDPDFETLVMGIQVAGQTLAEKGFRKQLLAVVFKFQAQGSPAYWIYNCKREKFYPFVPGEGQNRDHDRELRLHTLMEKELPLEEELEQWYPLWGLPV